MSVNFMKKHYQDIIWQSDGFKVLKLLLITWLTIVTKDSFFNVSSAAFPR